MRLPTSTVSRRRLLAMFGAGGIAAAAAYWLPAAMRQGLPYAADLDDAEVAAQRQAVIAASITFLGVLFGHALTAEDREELRERLDYTVDQEPQRLEDYAVLMRHLDRSAANRGAASFTAADAPLQARLLDDLMNIRYNTRTARWMSRLSPPTARHYRMRSGTVPALSWLYANSGVIWRTRGYDRWPGIPGSWRDVLIPGKPYP